ncbi:hypothetical protein Anas_05240, partial [Armadillidium nasatum]
YDDLLMFEFQGKVSSATFLSPEILIATSKNTNGRYEILKLAVPDRLLAVKDAGLIKNRDFSVLSAGYLKNEATCVISSCNLLVTSEEEGINLYSIPKEEDSDCLIKQVREVGNEDMVKRIFGINEYYLITYKSCIRRLRHPQICCDGSNLISGTKLNNIKFHCIENGKETQDYSSIFEDPNLLGSNFLSYLNSSCNELIVGCRDTGLLQNFDIRSQKSNSVELNEKNCKWSYSLSYNRRNVCIVNSLGYFYLFDTRNLSKEISKLKFDYDVCEENGIYLRIHFDPSDSFVSISGFDKCVNVF